MHECLRAPCARYDIAVCPIKMFIISIIQAFPINTRYVRTSELLQDAKNHAPLMIRVERDRTRSTQAYQSYREGHSGGATAQPARGEAHLSAHERIAPPRCAWRAPQRQRAACEGGRSTRSARRAAAASPTQPRSVRAAGRRSPRPAACAPPASKVSALSAWHCSALPTHTAGTRSVVSHGSRKWGK